MIQASNEFQSGALNLYLVNGIYETMRGTSVSDLLCSGTQFGAVKQYFFCHTCDLQKIWQQIGAISSIIYWF